MLLFLRGQGLAEAGHDLGLDRKLFGRTFERRLGERAGDAVELEQDPARLHPGDPEFGAALARAHADFGRLRADRNVREHADPKTAGTLDVTRDRAACRLDLASRDPLGLHGLEAEGAEVELSPALGVAVDAALEGLAEPGALGLQHDLLSFALTGCRALRAPDGRRRSGPPSSAGPGRAGRERKSRP